MITKEMIKQGYEKGIVKLETDPNLESGTVCKIGDNWFYFYGKLAADLDPEQYKKTVSKEDIVLKIFETLNEWYESGDETFEDEYAYYECILKEALKAEPNASSDTVEYGEIRIDYIDDEDMFWRVDAWMTDDDNEEGTVIAYIDNLTGRVLYTDPLARISEYAQDEIKAKVTEIKNENRYVIAKTNNGAEIRLRTQAGLLVASVETTEEADCEVDGIYLGIDRLDNETDYADVACLRAIDERTVRVNLWEEEGNEDCTRSFDLMHGRQLTP